MKIYINSEGQVANDLTIQLSEPAIGFKKIRLLKCTLHNSWHNIDTTHNRVRIFNGKEWIRKEIEPGNYNIDTLSDMLGPYVTLKKMPATGKVKLILSDKCKIDLAKLANLIGFESALIEKTKKGKCIADFLAIEEQPIIPNLIFDFIFIM